MFFGEHCNVIEKSPDPDADRRILNFNLKIVRTVQG
jgi:hypothetical protein